MKKPIFLAMTVFAVAGAHADTNFFNLSSGNFFQNWSNTSLITANDDWSGVPSIMGFLGRDDSGSPTGVDPQTLLADSWSNEVDVIANQTNPNTLTTGGVAEFDGIANPAVALQGSGTADAPHLRFYMNATNRTNIRISYNLIDVDGSGDNSIQPVALQYRIGGTGDFVNVPSAFVADASGGPNQSGLTTPVTASLAAWDNASMLEFRVMTTNAVGSDEWIAIDDIAITSEAIPEPATMLILGSAAAAFVARRRKR
ncbi:PEP-CTERM sorting domain-containing protein [Kamptonema cortianum]|nr:PEP-CTERM sorting domain-containing protein [Geitlerinema splendidum]MDK3156323.1 PEP-CTERM sorting domain-containing protein [Kamptonema cortianum]